MYDEVPLIIVRTQFLKRTQESRSRFGEEDCGFTD